MSASSAATVCEAGKFRFRLKAGNGEILAVDEADR